MKNIKNVVFLLILFVILGIAFFYQESISNLIIEKYIYHENITISSPNAYSLDYDYHYVKTTDDFKANSYQELLNIVYTGLNNGDTTFYFYCHYDTCEDDVYSLIDNHNLVNIINFVHPYNSYRQASIAINSIGKVTFKIEKAYQEQTINTIEEKLAQIKKEIITPEMTNREKIKAFHDYIINSTRYDTDYINSGIIDIDHPSHKAVGPLFYGKALCGGYTDVMAIFLNDLGIPNYRVSSEYHVWNLVKLDDTWYHLDLTWDDPVTSDNSDSLLDTFFLITTEQLESFNTGYHSYDKTIFWEAGQ